MAKQLVPNEAKKVMTQRGYTLHSHNSANTVFNFTRIIDSDIIIHSTVWIETSEMNLSTVDGLLTISTGNFSFNHPSFERVFEAPIVRAARILK